MMEKGLSAPPGGDMRQQRWDARQRTAICIHWATKEWGETSRWSCSIEHVMLDLCNPRLVPVAAPRGRWGWDQGSLPVSSASS